MASYPVVMAPGWRGWGRESKGGVVEDMLVRQYRYLLTTAPLDVCEGVHVEVVAGMSETDRGAMLRAVAQAFGTGRHVGADETTKLAHLVAAGAHRSPDGWIGSLDAGLARRVAEAALDAEGSFGRLNGYADWDGASPDGVAEASPNDGFDPNANRYRVDSDPRFNINGGGGGGYSRCVLSPLL